MSYKSRDVINAAMTYLDEHASEVQHALRRFLQESSQLMRGEIVRLAEDHYCLNARLKDVPRDAAFVYWSLCLWIPWDESVHGQRDDIEWDHPCRLTIFTREELVAFGNCAARFAETVNGSVQQIQRGHPGFRHYAIVPEEVIMILGESKAVKQ